jgi:hypothetical protein
VIAQQQRAAIRSSPKATSREDLHADPRPEPETLWDDEDRWAMIAENAYYRAEQRGFVPGYDLRDWLAAEREIDALTARATPP